MSQQLKLLAYVLLLGCAAWFAIGFFKNYSVATADRPVAQPTNEISETATNQAAVTPPDTNAVTLDATNNAADTNLAAATKQKPPQSKTPPAPVSKGRSASSMMGYAVGLFAVVICLGLLIAHDFSRFAAHRFERFIFDEDLEGAKDPEYEEAEKVWANGQFLEAIQLMRDYLKTHPREQYVALRIAEIYEQDLGNFLAAALEYEEVLKKKLPAERWGWAAIHLSNLYSGKLNRSQDAVTLLQRIIAEYGQTAAARKARERLTAEGIEIPQPQQPESAAPLSTLPPGFSRKDR